MYLPRLKPGGVFREKLFFSIDDLFLSGHNNPRIHFRFRITVTGKIKIGTANHDSDLFYLQHALLVAVQCPSTKVVLNIFFNASMSIVTVPASVDELLKVIEGAVTLNVARG